MIKVYNFAGTKFCSRLKNIFEQSACLQGDYVKTNNTYLLAPTYAYVVEFYDKKLKYEFQRQQALA